MSLNLTLQTTLDYDSEFQSLMNTMVLLSSFFKYRNNLNILKGQQSLLENTKKELIESADKFNDITKILGINSNVKSEYEVIAGMLVRNPRAILLDKRYNVTKEYLKNAPAETVIRDGVIIFTKDGVEYPFTMENIPIIKTIINDNTNLKMPQFKTSVKTSDWMPSDIEGAVKLTREAIHTNEKLSSTITRLEDVHAKTINKIMATNKTIRDIKLKAGYVLIRNLDRR